MTKVHGDPLHHVDYNAMVEGINQNGVLSGLAVSQKGAGADMSVDVAAGSALVDEDKYTEAGVTNVAIDASEVGKHRKDTIIYDTATSTPIAIKGSSVVSTDTSVPPSVTADDILLAVVYIGDAVASILDANIYDGRIFISAIKDNWTAITDPDNNDDTGDGYEIGSRWINTSKKSYFVCVKATAGLAVWRGTYSAASAPTVTDDDAHGFTIGSQWVDTAADVAYICTDAATGAANWITTTATVQLITQSIATIATEINGFLVAAVPAGMMNGWGAPLSASIFNEAGLTAANSALIFNEAGLAAANSALIFNEAGLTAANSALIFNEAGLTTARSALICNEAGFTFANKALMFREAGLSIANINAIIIHANISDDNAQQILSEITQANRDLTSAANVYEILDDWDDNKLTGRDGAGTTSTGFTNLFAHKDKFRPVWTVANGTPSAAGGVLSVPAGNVTPQHITTPSSFVTGTWEYDHQYLVLPTAYLNFYMFSDAIGFLAAENGYRLGWNSNNLLYLEKVTAGSETTLMNPGAARDTAQHTIKVTRDGSGNWEIFVDTVSKGTTIDNTHTTANYIQITSNATQTTEIDNLRVY